MVNLSEPQAKWDNFLIFGWVRVFWQPNQNTPQNKIEAWKAAFFFKFAGRITKNSFGLFYLNSQWFKKFKSGFNSGSEEKVISEFEAENKQWFQKVLNVLQRIFVDSFFQDPSCRGVSVRAAALMTVSRFFCLEFSFTKSASVISSSASPGLLSMYRIWSFLISSNDCWNCSPWTKRSMSVTSGFIRETEKAVRTLSIVDYNQMSLKFCSLTKFSRASFTVKWLHLSFTYEVSDMVGSGYFASQKIYSVV